MFFFVIKGFFNRLKLSLNLYEILREHLCANIQRTSYAGYVPTCDLVSILLRHAPVVTFQNRIQRSAVPPPLANTLLCQGHQDTAYTFTQDQLIDHSKKDGDMLILP